MIKKAVSLASLGIAIAESAWAHPGSTPHESSVFHSVVEHADPLLVMIVILAAAPFAFAKRISPGRSPSLTPQETRSPDPWVRFFAEN